MATTDIIVKIATSLGKALGGSSTLFSDFSTEAWGVQLPQSVLQSTAVNTALLKAEDAATRIEEASIDLENAVASNNQTEIIQAVYELGLHLKEFITAIDELIQGIDSSITSGTIADATTRALAQSFAQSFAKNLLDNIIISAIEGYIPKAMLVLKVLGLADWGYKGPEQNNTLFRGYVKKRLHLERIKDLITDPENHFKNTIGWGDNSFNPKEYFQIFTEFFDEEDSIFAGENAGIPFLKYGSFELKKLATVSPPGLQFLFTQYFNQTANINSPINDTWGLNLSAMFGLSGGITLNILPPFQLELLPPSGTVEGEVKAFIDVNQSKRPLTVIGNSNDLIQLTVENISLGVGLKAIWDVINSKANIDPLLFGDIKGATLKLGTANADSFVGNLLSNANIEGGFDLGFEWLYSSGLRIKASGGIEIALPIHQKLGILEINTIYLALKILSDGKLSTEVSASFTGVIGPLSVVVEQIGVQVDLKFNDSTEADFGFFDLDFGFKPPNGLGLSINAGAVIGGGYLFFDFEKEEYAGALELTIAGFISAKAIGLITTKMPDGSKGFSMLIIITAEFNPPFQLGYGFTLMGVGGLLGLNRTVLLDPLREGVRTGAVNNIMFPQNVIANATRIISDLKTIFPAYEGKFLIGPMAKIGWGTPTIVSISFGLIIEIPGNLAILGVLSVILPDKAAPIVKIQVAFVGTIDFDKQMLTFDASLYESSILTMTLEGDMAVRLKWGDNPDFLFTVGGFHPSFTPPPLALPTLKRLAINILNTSIAKIRVECYQAITSNTVQFGARADIFFDLSVCSITGFIAFDALFQFSPFYFIISIAAGFKLKVAGFDLLSVRVSMSLEGPTPWRAKGTGSISLLFFDVSADFDKTWGEQRNTTLESKAILTELLTALGKKEQWSTLLSTNKNLYVSLRTLNEATESLLVLHPAGSLVVQQKLLPFTINIDKIGNQKVADVKQISVISAQSGASNLQLKTVNEDFARAQYQNLSDAEKLSKPSFEKMPGGVEISMGGNLIKNGKLVRKKVAYELTIVDKEPTKKRNKFFALSGVLFANFLKGNSVSKLSISKAYNTQLKPFEDKVELTQPGYTVAFQSNNKALDVNASFESEMAAQTYMQTILKQQPNLKSKVHIVPNFELQEI